jgi:hypothetical protein
MRKREGSAGERGRDWQARVRETGRRDQQAREGWPGGRGREAREREGPVGARDGPAGKRETAGMRAAQERSIGCTCRPCDM